MNQQEMWNKKYEKRLLNSDLTKEDIWIKKYRALFEENKEHVMLDLGCGTGIHSYYLHDEGFKVIACDFSETAVGSVGENYRNIQVENFDMTLGLPFDKASCGVVLASLSTHYFTLSDTVKLYRDIYEVLVDSGYFIFRVNSYNEYINKDRETSCEEIERDYYKLKDGSVKRYFTVDSMSALLKDFKIISIKEETFTYFDNKKYFIEGVVQKYV